ncbi:MAG: AI-2E family transporter [Jaaginema sp. PMC 1079.18]|nr:AI-2E family transporter [Jaaginema sp. PMC 1080.18]MEC4850937.1 AI-2E family transporter [Jaaginema sp. PMC 1079.18]MEC4865747.1 AI-2E family transporter [Jaaginema sp. PMC 1078.18]
MSTGKFLGFVCLLIALYIVWRIRQIILLAFTAIIFATILNRFVKKLQRGGIRHGVAVAIAVVCVLLILSGFFAIVVPAITDQWGQLVTLVPDAIQKLRSSSTWLENLIPLQLTQDIENFEDFQELMNRFPAVDGNWVGSVFRVFSGSLSFVLNLLLVTFVAIMLLANPRPYRRVFILLFPAFYRDRIDEVLTKSENALLGWFIGILFNMSIIGVLSGIGLLLLGVPLAFVNALLAGVLTFIPNVGPVLSVIPPAALGLLENPWKALAVVILYIAIQQIESNILTPLVMQHQVSLLPAITLLSQVAFAVFFGLLGLFLALPIVIVAQVWFKEILIKDILNNWDSPHRRHFPKFATSSENSTTNQ